MGWKRHPALSKLSERSGMEDNFQGSHYIGDGTQAAPRNLPLSFTGSGSEYFRIWIVNALLSIITLGIYSAWAKVRTLQYFYRKDRKSTRLNSSHVRIS